MVENQKILEFWTWMQNNEEKLFNTLRGFTQQILTTNVPPSGEPVMLTKLSNRLKRVHPDLSYEFNSSLDEEGKLIFFLSPSGRKELFSLVKEMVELKLPLKYFNVVAFKQPASEDFLQDSKVYLTNGKSSSLKDIYFDYVEGEDNRLDFTFYVRGYNRDFYSILEQLFPILDKLIGEYYVATMIGGIDVEPLEGKNKRDLFELLTLRDMVEMRTGERLINM